jgi:hypothetical protein
LRSASLELESLVIVDAPKARLPPPLTAPRHTDSSNDGAEPFMVCPQAVDAEADLS